MADYRAIKGLSIQNVSSDNPTVQAGDIWYNSTLGKVRAAKLVGAWSSGGNLNATRASVGGLGIQTAAMSFGGAPPNTGSLAISETYDGSSWTEGSNLNVSRRYPEGMGTTTAGLAAVGRVTPGSIVGDSEEYNGTSWTESENVNTPRAGCLGSAGTQTAGLIFGQSPPYGGIAESYDGSTWTEVGDMSTGRAFGPGGCGTSTAALGMGGYLATGVVAVVELYNGTSWTEVGDLGTARYGAGAGIQTAALVAGGGPAGKDEVETYDGSSWTEVAALSTGRGGAGSGRAGSNTTTVIFAGYTGSAHTALTEEWDTAIAKSSITSS